jgi:hypothetical protein
MYEQSEPCNPSGVSWFVQPTSNKLTSSSWCFFAIIQRLAVTSAPENDLAAVQVAIDAMFIELEGPFDYLDFHLGLYGPDSMPEWLGSLNSVDPDSGSVSTKLTFVIEKTNPIEVTFRTDGSFRYRGFWLEYAITAPPPPTATAVAINSVEFTLAVVGMCKTFIPGLPAATYGWICIHASTAGWISVGWRWCQSG